MRARALALAIAVAVVPASARAQPPDRPDRARAAWIAGIAVCASAAAPAIAAGAGLGLGRRAQQAYDDGPTRADRDRADRLGASANALAFGGALASAMLLGIGASLLVLGAPRRPRTRAIQAALAPGGAGLVVRARF